MSEGDVSIKVKSRWRFLFHPSVVALTTFCTVVSVPLAIYFGYQSQSVPALTFYEYPVRSMVVSKGVPSPLTVSFNGTVLTDSVYAFQCAVWNAGTAPIKREDILSAIAIKSAKNVHILVVSIRKTSRPETAFSMDTKNLSDGVIGLDWRVLEHNDFAEIEILYEGDLNAQFTVTGSLLGQKVIHEMTNMASGTTSQSDLYRERANAEWIFPVVCLSSVPMFIFLDRLDKRSSRRMPKFARLILYLIALYMLIVGLYSLYDLIFKSVPFNF